MKKCKTCGKEFEPCKGREETSHFCSIKCFNISRRKQNEFIICDGYAKIMLKNSKNEVFEVIIDIEDIDRCKKLFWRPFKSKKSKVVYAIATLRDVGNINKNIRLHRYILDAKEGQIIDHINRNGLDNRKENIRFCTHSENMLNTNIRINNKTGYKGIWKQCNKYIVSFKKQKVGSYNSLKEAIVARKEAERKYYNGV